MKVAIYSCTIPSTTFIESLIEGLSSSGVQIFLFGKKTKELNYNKNVRVIKTPQGNISLSLFVVKEFFKLFFGSRKLFSETYKCLRNKNLSLKKTIKDAGVILPIINNKPDVFHIQWAKAVDRYPELFDLLDCKFVLSLRGAHINYSPLHNKKLAESYRKYFPRVDRFHAVSKAIAGESIKYGADPDKIEVINSSIRDELLENTPITPSGLESIKIISVGRFHWKKGYHYALDTFRILREKRIKFEYTIVAQGEIPEEILFLINEYGFGDEIKIVPGLAYDLLIERMKQSQLLLLPSVEEGIANVVLEAMALGVPVITTDCGGMSEVITNKINGYIVRARNPAMMATSILDFVRATIETRKALAECGRQTILGNFTRAKQISEFLKLYNSLILNSK